MNESLIAELRGIQIEIRSSLRNESEESYSSSLILDEERAYRKRWAELDFAERSLRLTEYKSWTGIRFRRIYDPIGDSMRSDIASGALC